MKRKKKIPYKGKMMTRKEIADMEKTSIKAVYRYLSSHGTMEGFDKRRSNIRVEYNGREITLKEAAQEIGIQAGSIGKYYKRYGTIEGCGKGRVKQGESIPHLQKYYHTLDASIPIDKSVLDIGYRSMRQFCRANNLPLSKVCAWRMGRTSKVNKGGVVTEMVTQQHGLSDTLVHLMNSTGCLEWELFPNIFTEEFYKGIYKHLATLGGGGCIDASVECRETQRVVRRVIRSLPPRNSKAIEMFFGLGEYKRDYSLLEIGKAMGVSRERARMIVADGMRKIRTSPSRLRALAAVARSL